MNARRNETSKRPVRMKLIWGRQDRCDRESPKKRQKESYRQTKRHIHTWVWVSSPKAKVLSLLSMGSQSKKEKLYFLAEHGLARQYKWSQIRLLSMGSQTKTKRAIQFTLLSMGSQGKIRKKPNPLAEHGLVSEDQKEWIQLACWAWARKPIQNKEKKWISLLSMGSQE